MPNSYGTNTLTVPATSMSSPVGAVIVSVSPFSLSLYYELVSDEEFFVPILPTIKTPPPSLHGEWKVIEIDEKTSYKVQTHCDVGLEWIVEDQEVGEIICTLCCRTYKKDSTEGINNHIRSYMHLNRYLVGAGSLSCLVFYFSTCRIGACWLW